MSKDDRTNSERYYLKTCVEQNPMLADVPRRDTLGQMVPGRFWELVEKHGMPPKPVRLNLNAELIGRKPSASSNNTRTNNSR